MKKFLILSLVFYQKIVSPAIHSLLGINKNCRFDVTCSEYAKNKITNEGAIKGGYLSLIRLFKCQPFYNGS